MSAFLRAEKTPWYNEWKKGVTAVITLPDADVLFHAAEQLSNHELIARVKALVQCERESTAALIAHLAILDERGLYLHEGYSSLFSYCTQGLHLSEGATYWRIEAARAARKFPVILGMLADGSLHLTAVVRLAPHLTPGNHAELLKAAIYKGKSELKELIVSLRPLPSVPSTIRKLPIPNHRDSDSNAELLRLMPGTSETDRTSAPPSVAPVSSGLISSTRRGSVEPLAPERYKVQFTAGAELYAKMRQVQNMLRHQIPDGDLEQVMDYAFTVAVEKLERQKFAATNRPKKNGSGQGNGSRHIPANVRRAVFSRDAGQCAFVSETGRRCIEQGFLEFHHVVPYSLGGQATSRISSCVVGPTMVMKRSGILGGTFPSEVASLTCIWSPCRLEQAR